MNPDSINLVDLVQEAGNWPGCPACGAKKMLFGGLLAGCIDCLFLGEIELVELTPVMKTARAKIANRIYGNRGIVLVHHGRYDLDNLQAVSQKASQLGQYLTHYEYLLRCRARLERTANLKPVLITEENEPEDGNVAVGDWTPERQVAAARENLLSLIYETNEKLDTLTTKLIGDERNSRLILETHLYNGPTILQGFSFSKSSSRCWNFKKLSFAECRKTTRRSLIWQPICWDVIPFSKQIQPTWLAALEIHHPTNGTGLNATYCVAENLDNGPIAQLAIRAPGSLEPPNIQEFKFQTAEQAIEAMKRHRMEILAKNTGIVVFNEEQSWDLAANPNTILFEIRNNPLWVTYSACRK